MEELDIGIQSQYLEREIESHPGFIALERIGAIGNMHYIYENNFKEFEDHLSELSVGEGALSLCGDRTNADKQTLEAIRLLHNLLAGIKSLVDNERWLIRKWYSGHYFENEHAQKIEELFVTSDAAKFIEELRNYFLHKSYPDCGFQITTEYNDYKARFLLYRDGVLSNWDWSDRSKKFLENREETFEILEIVRGYKILTLKFYCWLEDRIRSIHEKEIVEVKEMEKKLHGMYRVLGHAI